MTGPVEQAVTADLEEWGSSGSLAALAISLAQELDGRDHLCKACGGPTSVQIPTAALSKELRATLAELAPKVDDDADLDAALVAGLSTAVEHSKN